MPTSRDTTTPPARFEALLREISLREQRVLAYMKQPRFLALFEHEHIREGVFAYVDRPAKRLRPAVLLFSCGAVGGDEARALPVAAAVELTHTWTLTHDDIIDKDPLRRGLPTVHVLLGQRARAGAREPTPAERHEYGTRAAILVGDAQHAWSMVAMLDAAGAPSGVDPQVAICLARILESEAVQLLIKGEALDIEYEDADRLAIPEADVIEMLRLKTGVLYEFAAMAGAMVGLGTTDRSNALVQALSLFAGRCGVAFQLQDDVLGVTGNERTLGKPVGSDLREGKCTTIVLHAMRTASPADRRFLAGVLGARDVAEPAIARARELLIELGSVDYTRNLARRHLLEGRRHLEAVPDSPYRRLLDDWASYLLDRDL